MSNNDTFGLDILNFWMNILRYALTITGALLVGYSFHSWTLGVGIYLLAVTTKRDQRKDKT